MRKKWIRYVLWALIAFVAIWLLVFTIAFFYIKIRKDAIVSALRITLNEKITGRITFDDLTIDLFKNFPGISIDVKNFHIRDSSFDNHKRELMRVNVVSMGFGLVDLIAGNKNPKYLTLSDGQIFLFADSLGNKNWNILKEQGKSRSPQKVGLKKIKFKNINAFFHDVKKRKFYNVWFEKMKCNIDDNNEKIDLELESRAVIKSAYFNMRQGSYLTGKKLISKLDLFYDKPTGRLSLKNQIVNLNKQAYRITGDFYLRGEPHFTLAIKAKNLSLKEAASIFPSATAKKMNRFQLSKPLRTLDAVLSGPMKYRSYPLAKISFSVVDAKLEISPTSFDHCTFNGFLQNEIDSSKARTDSNSYLQFSNVKGEWEKNSFDSKKITFYNLIHPYLRCDIHTRFDVGRLEKAIATRQLDFNGGTGEATLDYAGPLETGADTVYKLNGIIRIQNGDITYNPRSLDFKNTDIELHFVHGDLLVKHMNTVVNENKIRINGQVKDFLNFFNTDPSKVAFNWNIYSPLIDISKLRSSLRRSSTVKKKKEGYTFFERLNTKIDRLFDACNAYLDVQTDQVVYKNFSAKKISGHVALTNDMVKLENFSLLHAGGSVQFSAFSKDKGVTSDLSLQSRMQDVDVKELFSSFNNFGMESLTSKNISGTFSADISLISMLDENGNLVKPANKGYVDFSLKNGRIENFKPLMEIDNNFLQKRDLSDVRFAELKDRLELNGNDIHVNRIEIQSTAVSMYVEGTYSFATNTDLSIQIPLKDQKKDRVFAPRNKGLNAKTGMSIFLRARDDKEGKLKITYDLFGRFRSKG